MKREGRYLMAGLIALMVLVLVGFGVNLTQNYKRNVRQQVSTEVWAEVQDVRVLALVKKTGGDEFPRAVMGGIVGGLLTNSASGAVAGAVVGAVSADEVKMITEFTVCALGVKVPGFDNYIVKFSTEQMPLSATQRCALQARGDRLKVTVTRNKGDVSITIPCDTFRPCRGELIPR